jgi:glycosyltransferase involved in cell wall biosynthesis
MKWLFIGPSLKSGIAHVLLKYASLVDGEYVSFGQKPSLKHYDRGFTFILPIKDHLDSLDLYSCSEWIYMTVCETETVHESYSLLCEKFNTIHVPSEFSLNILKKQFPHTEWKLLRHYVSEPKCIKHISHTGYRFYTIGNIRDPRKNIPMLIESFTELNLPGSQLVLKATCIDPVELNIPNVVVINYIMSEDHLDSLHNSCDCYINCSHSEGVGMGAVEAAMRNKPVIISDYGGLKEYVKTPYIIKCTTGPIGFDDFLFQKDMIWGYPDKECLKKYMKECFDMRLTRMDHDMSIVQDARKIIYV